MWINRLQTHAPCTLAQYLYIVYSHACTHTPMLTHPFTSVYLHGKYVKHSYWITFQFCAFMYSAFTATHAHSLLFDLTKLDILSLLNLFSHLPIQSVKIIATFLFTCSRILFNAHHHIQCDAFGVNNASKICHNTFA